MTIVLNSFEGALNFEAALQKLTHGASSLSIGVSYLQMGGWKQLRSCTQPSLIRRTRLVCTDQMNITQPAAVKQAIADGAQVRNFSGSVTYHPKMILAEDADGNPISFLIGSANLSASAYTYSIEAGLLGSDPEDLSVLKYWFDDVFENHAEEFSSEQLESMEIRWKHAASARARSRLKIRRDIIVTDSSEAPILAEDVDTLEDIFATLQTPIGLLNFDYAGNNIRNLAHLRNVLADWDRVRVSKISSKPRSELKLLGFVIDGELTQLGVSAVAAQSEEEVARLWCRWLQQSEDDELNSINPKLTIAKRVFKQFWRLQADVRDYFLSNAVQPQERRFMQTIELLCNSTEVVQELSLDDVRTLVPMLDQIDRLPTHVRNEISQYFENKGTRGWTKADRNTLPNAWHNAEQTE